MELVRGQKVKLSEIMLSESLEIGVELNSTYPAVVSCLGLDVDGKLSDERYFIYYNQKKSPCNSICSVGKKYGCNDVFSIELTNLPDRIQKIVFAVTFEGEGKMSSLRNSLIKIFAKGEPVAQYSFSGSDFGSEKAVMMLELYRKDVWRLAVSAQGFNGGLGVLLEHFGGREDSIPPYSAPSPKVNLNKVTLEKRGESQKVDLTKRDSQKPIHVNLQWDEGKQKTGFFGIFSSSSDAVDLDLGCMYRMKNGDRGVIQPLGGNFGSRDSLPFIFLDKDDRTGSAADGENMYIFKPEMIDLLVVFALIYEGTAKFTDVNGRIIIKDNYGAEIAIPLNNPDRTKRFCAVARIQNKNDEMVITKDELYFTDHEMCDKHYGFGFRWVAGRK